MPQAGVAGRDGTMQVILIPRHGQESHGVSTSQVGQLSINFTVSLRIMRPIPNQHQEVQMQAVPMTTKHPRRPWLMAALVML